MLQNLYKIKSIGGLTHRFVVADNQQSALDKACEFEKITSYKERFSIEYVDTVLL